MNTQKHAQQVQDIVAVIIFAVIMAMAIGFIIWTFASWVDVLAHQMTGGTDAAWNLFVMMTN